MALKQDTLDSSRMQSGEITGLRLKILLADLLDHMFNSMKSKTYYPIENGQGKMWGAQSCWENRSAVFVELPTGYKGPSFDSNQLLWKFHYWSNMDQQLHWNAQLTRLILFCFVVFVEKYFLVLRYLKNVVFGLLENPRSWTIDSSEKTFGGKKPEFDDMFSVQKCEKKLIEVNLAAGSDSLVIFCTQTYGIAFSGCHLE